MSRLTNQNRDILISGLAFGMAYYFIRSSPIVIIAVAYMLTCFAFPRLKAVNHIFWSRLTLLLQSIMQPILFGIIFIVVVIPIGLLFRLFHKKKRFTDSTFEGMDQSKAVMDFEVPW